MSGESAGRVVDLFAGAGGLSLGFERAGFRVALAVDSDPGALETYARNREGVECLRADLSEAGPAELAPGGEFRGVIGGPPCQGFSTVGKREPGDPRNSLFRAFAAWVERLEPEFYAMENVPGILTMEGGAAVDRVRRAYRRLGYSCQVLDLLAADYGVPQLRRRVFFVGFRGGRAPVHPRRTHQQDPAQATIFPEDRLPGYLTVSDALSDILGLRPSGGPLPYPSPPRTRYQRRLREGSEGVRDHLAPDHGAEVERRISALAQGEQHSDLPPWLRLEGLCANAYGRLDLGEPAGTITGNAGCPSAPGRFVHPTQDRALSVREAARLQSFPDAYRFSGGRGEMYRQVGNAVPPRLAGALAGAILARLE